MDHLRYGVILIIVAAFAGGVWTRYFPRPRFRLRPGRESLAPENSGFQLTGTFDVLSEA